ncbi:FAD-dependent tricarballylate dehydrogenase TcuA [Schinkia azotoformans]|uniref:FAD-dependent tricarballylate dehydrogenase TcuA n=1 Tax=Schinkia azotoformans TaxID=1454 RepID=UPI002DB880A8|nr:FAD-dependent tricarballylate dehydrogenase TcuA [Schinkia azotoformans]MEC1716072.1 FAD-dependent tricarballylate dehydrogenase TcuA [Schinkia azotoformans]MEC1740543.1 FAD-dependent tricarballylate dehydrogenase TcuA [Schinkia azotoformans]MEC1756111.1 FAD-dependent tricarballylate dehydrogenase TcuA [Schinkia azotoformans]MEC1768852.1 FAD-dependent tricarballylate dehydrogenase TcuA [Schinkia azotoformans]MEC1788408.1 FAD-dependent tricarballylate dehydrogenase TcuA [Schinkia azotoforman
METEVLVVGGGNAAMAAALSARDRGAKVLVIERAPHFYRGGNSRLTRDYRCMHLEESEYMMGQYTEEEFLDDLKRVAGGEINESLARLIVRKSAELPDWLESQGVRWQPTLSGTLHLGRTNIFQLGGGKAVMNSYYQTAKKKGIEVLYDAKLEDVVIENNEFKAAKVLIDNKVVIIKAKMIIFACGGFEANIEWHKRYWGEAADNFVIRGTPYNTGNVLEMLLNKGAAQVGEKDAFHAVAVDGRAPKFDGGIVTRLDSVPFGIVVNKNGQRFYDEGEDFWPKRYAIWGGLIARQPDQVAYSIIDSEARSRFLPTVWKPESAPTIKELAGKLGLNPDAVEKTVKDFNNACRPGNFNPAELDDCKTEGLTPQKSHWALKIEKAPFYAYPLRTGITFTYLAVKVNEEARMIMEDGSITKNMFACGEIAAGNVLRRGYLAGFGLTMGACLGRIAGEVAANGI